MKIEVIKRDGSKEKYSPEKIERVVKAAGLSESKTHTLVNELNTWIQTLNTNEIESLQIRDKVTEELKKLDEYSANMYMWYQKTKEN